MLWVLKKCMVLLVMACLVVATFSIYNLEPKIIIHTEVITTPVVPKIVDKTRMLAVVVRIDHRVGSGSGVIIYCAHMKQDDKYVYYVITNYHVTRGRLIRELEVDGIRGGHRIITKDPGVVIRVFYNAATEWKEYDGQVIVESPLDDLALIKFQTSDYLSYVVDLIDTEAIVNAEVFDTVYAVGCQIGELVIPTKGIISGFVEQDDVLLIIHTTHILPGSSGGGLFKRYDDQYHLIGLPFAARWYNFQIIPHYSYSISIEMIYRFLCNNNMSFIYENGMVNEVQHAG